VTATQWLGAYSLLPSHDLHADLAFYTDTLGFQLQTIYPADNPRVAELAGFGLRLRLDREWSGDPGTVCLQTASMHTDKLPDHSPSGTRIVVNTVLDGIDTPPTQHCFEVRELRDADPWVIGRAGMHYRDLIPSRLGGSIIASHIRIPEGGPVPDMVHYHEVGFQLIYCYRGWVKLVYEDQGPPFILHAGNCVTQPPRIRHRVLESSAELEVVEIGVPAEHVTSIDHSLQLPTKNINRERLFDGQRFCHFNAAATPWTAHRLTGYEQRDTGIANATSGKASVRIVKPTEDSGAASCVRAFHDTDILFGFVLEGQLSLRQAGVESDGAHVLKAGDAFTLPPDAPVDFAAPSADLSWLEVALPGEFTTTLVNAATAE